MANFSRTDTTVSNAENVLDALKNFLTASGPGPTWVEDATFLNTANPEQFFIRTAGATQFFVYLETVSDECGETIHAYWVPDTGNGYGGAAGPTNHFTTFNAFMKVDAALNHKLHMFANDDRVIVVLRSTVASGGGATFPNTDTYFQIMYLGGYTSHADAVDDPYPLMAAANGHCTDPDGTQWNFGSFPEVLVKKIGPTNIPYGDVDFRGWISGSSIAVETRTFRKLHEVDFKVPKNSRGGEAFAYPQEVFIDFPGAEESFGLTGMFVATPDVGIQQTVTIGAATFYSVPQLSNVYPGYTYPGGPRLYGNIYLIPLGTSI